MTNANVMALGVQVAAPVKGSKGMGSALGGSSKGNFDEALGRLQQEVQAELSSAGKDETPQDMDARDGGNGRDGVPHSSLAMVMSLPAQQLPEEKVQIEAPAAVAEFSSGMLASSGDLIEEHNVLAGEERNLRSLLPQSDEAKVRNSDFLAMLSGNLTSSQREEAKGRLKAALQAGQAEEGQQAAGTRQPYAPQEGGGLRSGAASAADGQQKANAKPLNLWQLGTPLAAGEPTDPLGLALRQTARNASQAPSAAEVGQKPQEPAGTTALAGNEAQQLPREADASHTLQERTSETAGETFRQSSRQVPQGSPFGIRIRQQAEPAMGTAAVRFRQVTETADRQATTQEAMLARSAEPTGIAYRQSAAPVQQATETVELPSTTQEAMPVRSAEPTVMTYRQAAAPVQQATETVELPSTTQEVMPARSAEPTVMTYRQATVPVQQATETVDLSSATQEVMPARSAEPTGMTYRQSAAPVQQAAEAVELPSTTQEAMSVRSAEPTGMTYRQSAAPIQQAAEAVELPSTTQEAMSVRSAEPTGMTYRQSAAPVQQATETVDLSSATQEVMPARSAEPTVMTYRQATVPVQQAAEAVELPSTTQEAMSVRSAEPTGMTYRQSAAPVQQAAEAVELPSTTQEAMSVRSAEPTGMTYRQSAAPVQQATETVALPSTTQEAMPVRSAEPTGMTYRQSAAPVQQATETAGLPGITQEAMPARSAEPTMTVYRQAAGQMQVPENAEVAAPQETVPVPKDKEPVGMTYQQAVRNQQAVEAAGFEPPQPQMMVAAAERAAVRQEGGQPVLGDDLAAEKPETGLLKAMQGQEARGDSSFEQEKEGGSQPFQGKMAAAAMEAEEVAAPVTMPQHAGAVQAGSFQQHLQEAAPVGSSQAAPETQADYEVPRQIVEQARLLRSGDSTEMVIHLKPEHLGDLTLKISVTEGGAVTASFHSDNAQVRTIIENSLVQLRQELSDQGLKVDSVEVFSGLPDGQLPQGQGQQAWQQGQQGRFAGDRKPEDYAEEADDLAAVEISQSQESLTEDGVDYRV